MVMNRINEKQNDNNINSDGFLKKIRLIQHNTNNCLFDKYKNNKLCLLLTLYVDYMLITGEKKEMTKDIT